MNFIRQIRYRLEQGWGLVEAINITNWIWAVQRGRKREQKRIIKLWDEEMSCQCENPMPHLLERIKG